MTGNKKNKYSLIAFYIILVGYIINIFKSISYNNESTSNTIYFGLILFFYIIITIFFIPKKKYFSNRFNLFFFLLYFIILFFKLYGYLKESITLTDVIFYSLPLLAYTLFYYYSDHINPKQFNRLNIYVFIILSYLYFNEYKIATLLISENNNVLGLNTSYFPFLLLPLVLLSNKAIRILALILITLIIVTSLKRAALLTLIICIISIMYYYTFIIKSYRFKIMFFLVIGISLLINLNFSKIDSPIMSRIQQINEDEGSGRIEIYNEVIDNIKKSNLLDFILGHGDNSVSKITSSKLSSHNDFLEIIFNYGLIAFLFYLCIHYFLIKKLYYLIKIRSEFAPSYLFSYFQFLLLSILSHIIIYPYFILMCIYWGYINGKTNVKY